MLAVQYQRSAESLPQRVQIRPPSQRSRERYFNQRATARLSCLTRRETTLIRILPQRREMKSQSGSRRGRGERAVDARHQGVQQRKVRSEE